MDRVGQMEHVQNQSFFMICSLYYLLFLSLVFISKLFVVIFCFPFFFFLKWLRLFVGSRISPVTQCVLVAQHFTPVC